MLYFWIVGVEVKYEMMPVGLTRGVYVYVQALFCRGRSLSLSVYLYVCIIPLTYLCRSRG